ncbi:MAG: hypothetical protein ABJB47_05315 [Actinomycetota bacterium]
MTELLPAVASPYCQAGQACDRAPCFQARLEAVKGRRCVLQRAELCAEHLGGTVQALTDWAHDRGLEGKLTVLAIDRLVPGRARPLAGRLGFVFSTIQLA